MGIHSLQLLSGGNATGQWMQWTGGKGVLCVSGTAVNVALQMLSSDGSSAVAVTDAAGTSISGISSGTRTFELPDCMIRVAVTLGSNIYAHVDRVPG